MQEQSEYNVLISWSGERSKAIASRLRQWLGTVVQSCRPFMSDQDIGVGTRWQAEIAKHLATIKVGVFVITPENQHKPWVNYEAGAISREVDDGLAMAIIFGMDRSELTGPLTQFQNVVFGESDMRKLVHDINHALGKRSTDEAVATVFAYAWPKLKVDIESIPIPSEALPLTNRSEHDLLQEVVSTMRDLQQVVRKSSGEFEILLRSATAVAEERRRRQEASDSLLCQFTNPNRSLSLGHIKTVIGHVDTLETAANRLGVEPDELAGHLKRHMPGWEDIIVPF